MTQSIWTDTPCSSAYVTHTHFFQRSQRFKRFSIYHRDDVNKPKKVFNDIERPELLLIKFRRQIQQASSDRFKKKNDKGHRLDLQKSDRAFSGQRKNKTPTQSELVTLRLYEIKSKQDMQYDRYGNRSHLQKQLEVQRTQHEQKNKIRSMQQTKTTFFTTARRLDLARPLNFHPPPDKYSHHKPFLSDRKRMLGRLTDHDNHDKKHVLN